MTDLLPCPFCGCAVKASEYAVDDDGQTKWAVGCDCSDAPEGQPYAERYVNVHGFTRAEAIAAWNRRAPSISTEPRGGASKVNEALRFYANGFDWDPGDGEAPDATHPGSAPTFYEASAKPALLEDGGALAREVLAALSEPKGEGGASEARLDYLRVSRDGHARRSHELFNALVETKSRVERDHARGLIVEAINTVLFSATPPAEADKLRGIVRRCVDALDASRNGGEYPDFEKWEADARQALKAEG